jgi:hypothetical protein
MLTADRHGHLMLYDDANQVEVRYVISLAHHDVNIYGGEGVIPEGELWLKRNAIRLSRRLDSLADLGGPTPPFFLFSDNLSEKEDFYFAMLQNQTKMWDSSISPPQSQQFDVKHIVTLVQRLHSSEEQLQTRWINAVLGRLFLALYKTPEMEEFIRNKISKKISRANKPNIISRIGLQRIDMGEGAPFITNPRLKDLTVDGNCCVEADLQYTGNFRLVISATVRIDLGPRFKAREVDIVLAVVLKKLEGHILVRFKPPPSNRIWVSFETMPHMVMDIEPIVSSKQVTYGIILRTIESKIREIVAETLVQPFWDDIPFLDTLSQAFRGGIWQRDIPRPDSKADIPDESGGQVPAPEDAKEDPIDVLKMKDDRTMSMPVLSEHAPPSLKPRKGPKQSVLDFQSSWNASSSSVERPASSSLPRAIRTQPFSNAADPVVTADNAKVDNGKPDGQDVEKNNATSAMIEISSRSPPSSPNRTPAGSPPMESIPAVESVPQSGGASIAESIESTGELGDSPRSRSPSHLGGDSSVNPRGPPGSSSASISGEKLRRHNTLEAFTKSITSAPSDDKGISLGTATAAAKKWGWNMFGKGEQGAQDSSRLAGTPEQPIGRGHPLPPPGTPLPRPAKFALKRNSVAVPRRKPVPATPERSESEIKAPEPKQQLPKRKPVANQEQTGDRLDELLVVEAPQDSTPTSPADVDTDGHLTETAGGQPDDPGPTNGDHIATDHLDHDSDQNESNLAEGLEMETETPDIANPETEEVSLPDTADTQAQGIDMGSQHV